MTLLTFDHEIFISIYTYIGLARLKIIKAHASCVCVFLAGYSGGKNKDLRLIIET